MYEREQSTCSQNHRSTLTLPTIEGGSICLVCLSNLITSPKSPTIHVSYALSQLQLALVQPQFRSKLFTFHPHFLVSPLVESLSLFNDEAIAKQTIDVIQEICEADENSICGEFISRVAGKLASGSLAWSRTQVYTLHCLGILLGYEKSNPYSRITEKEALISNLIIGLQLPSEEIQGEILFVLYKISMLQYNDDDASDALDTFGPKLLQLSLEVLMKTQSDDVRSNCVALLTVLAHRGFFENLCSNYVRSDDTCEGDNFIETMENVTDGSPLIILFAEAIKGPLLSSDCELQVNTLDLIYLYLSRMGDTSNDIKVLVEENIADYVFEILRLSGSKDPAVTSCVRALDLLSTAEQAFRQRLACGFSTLLPVLRYVSEIPLHPVQTETLKLILICVSSCIGIVSSLHIDELGLTLAGMLKRYTDGDIGMVTETFSLACSVLVAIMKSPSSYDNTNFKLSAQSSSRHAILSCLSQFGQQPSQLMHSLYLLKEGYAYSYEGSPDGSSGLELRKCILNICKTDLLPWFMTAISEMEEENIALGILETFHSILLQDSDSQGTEFAKVLLSSSWFSFSFGCLGLFPTDKMRWRIYLLLSSIIDLLLGNDFGQPIRDAALHLPSDPTDLLFLLGQKTSNNLHLIPCHYAILIIIYISSLHDDRLADDKLVLASLEQYILVNSRDILFGSAESVPMELLVNLYGLYRGQAKMSYQILYSGEAEKILFNILAEKELDMLEARFHPTSLKWLFQQDRLCKLLCSLMLKFCNGNTSQENKVIMQGAISQYIHTIAEMIASEDNFAAKVLVYVLQELVDQDQEDDITSVLSFMLVIVNLFPAASDQLCLHGLGSALKSLYCHFDNLIPRLSMVICQLTFSILYSVHSETLSDEESWLEITMKLNDYLVATASVDKWTEGSLAVMGILSLALYHSTNNALVETSKTILLSTPLSSIMKNIIQAACSKGPALFDHDEGTKIGETLAFVLLLQFFSLQSIHAVLPGTVEWEKFLHPDKAQQPLSFMNITCHDLSRLMHFGSPIVKLVASYCLLELLTRISDQRKDKTDKVKCPPKYLSSIMAVLEGLVFNSDSKVAINSSLCLSMIIGWINLDKESPLSRSKKWCRLIVEELAMSLAVPRLASEFFMIHHLPAVHVAVCLLKLETIPEWTKSVFDDSCVAGIINNISAKNLSIEVVLLFRALLNVGYLHFEHLSSLNRIFQACRKNMYSNEVRDTEGDKHKEELGVPNDSEKIFKFLMKIISSQTSVAMNSGNTLLEELELFFKSSTEDGL